MPSLNIRKLTVNRMAAFLRRLQKLPRVSRRQGFLLTFRQLLLVATLEVRVIMTLLHLEALQQPMLTCSII